MKVAISCAALVLLAPRVASAEPVTLDLPGPVERSRASYTCSDGTVRDVDYINLPDNNLALLTGDGASRVFVGVIAGSGARYASGPYVWWTKGLEATLADVRAGEAPLATCSEKAG